MSILFSSSPNTHFTTITFNPYQWQRPSSLPKSAIEPINCSSSSSSTTTTTTTPPSIDVRQELRTPNSQSKEAVCSRNKSPPLLHPAGPITYAHSTSPRPPRPNQLGERGGGCGAHLGVGRRRDVALPGRYPRGRL
ncbi:hypothetical protein MRB53_026219 [Persea americana]|uniref:Uncharacterized protein n=1 Tax=Persea americana TaxID=3435 RepID=A0ACC2LI78_PERAE|nr:hypothetical protein MRB53_026219 [Persea americana]